MDPDFWHERWASGRIGFHREEVNPNLVEHAAWAAPLARSRVLVPLCGKTLDLGWLAERGHAPVGVELSPVAVEEVFAERGLEPERRPVGDFAERFRAGGIEVWRGDFLALSAAELGRFDGLWDRAALIALPASMRADYVALCAALLEPEARGLLVTMRYDPAEMEGPPFTVPPEDVEALYTPFFETEALVREHACEPSPHLRERGLSRIHESVWGLTRKPDVRADNNGS